MRNGRKIVLALDDNQGILDLLHAALTIGGVDADVMTMTHPDLLEAELVEGVDVAILDLMMPRRTDGEEALDLVRRYAPEAVVLLYTAAGPLNVEKYGPRFDEVFEKGGPVTDLIDRVEELCQ